MTSNQAVNKLICAEMNLGKYGNEDGASVIRTERMRLQSAQSERGLAKSEKAASIAKVQDRALHVLAMWADCLR